MMSATLGITVLARLARIAIGPRRTGTREPKFTTRYPRAATGRRMLGTCVPRSASEMARNLERVMTVRPGYETVKGRLVTEAKRQPTVRPRR
jgi:hypothetical protein